MAKKKAKLSPWRGRLDHTQNVIPAGRSAALQPPNLIPWVFLKAGQAETFRRRMLTCLIEAVLQGWTVDPRLIAIYL
jgi:hypothetical protein